MNDQNNITVAAKKLEDIASGLLAAAGYTEKESVQTAASLVLSTLKGHESHGIVRVAEYIHALKTGRTVSDMDLAILRETDTGLWADAQKGLGQVQMPRFLNRLFSMVKKQAVVSGALKRCGHTGRLGEWAERIVAAGFAGMILVNDNGAFQAVAPPGGTERVTSTNPMAFGIPRTKNRAFVFDMSTSATAIGKMRLKRMAGDSAPPGCLQDHTGQETTDPNVLFKDPKGALRAMGGDQAYKGFGLSMVVDLLAAGLSGGFAPPAPEDEDILNNVMVTIWNPEKFAGRSHMMAQAQKYIEFLKQSPAVDPDQPVRLPGERSARTQEKRLENGIPLSFETVRVLCRSADIVGIPRPSEFKPACEDGG